MSLQRVMQPLESFYLYSDPSTFFPWLRLVHYILLTTYFIGYVLFINNERYVVHHVYHIRAKVSDQEGLEYYEYYLLNS